MPETILTARDLWPPCEPYYEAFQMLSKSRHVGDKGPLPIAVSEIIALGTALYHEGSDLLDFITLVQRCDTEWLAEVLKTHG